MRWPATISPERCHASPTLSVPDKKLDARVGAAGLGQPRLPRIVETSAASSGHASTLGIRSHAAHSPAASAAQEPASSGAKLHLLRPSQGIRSSSSTSRTTSCRLPARQQLVSVTTCSSSQRPFFVDRALVTGDAIVLVCTQLSSSRLPPSCMGIVGGLLVATWTAVSWAKRDYSLSSEDYDAWQVTGPVASAVQSATLTWVLFAPMVAAAYSLLASNGLVAAPNALLTTHGLPEDGAGLMWLLGAENSVPEMEVIIALLFMMAAWRGLYSAYRAWSNFY